MPMPNRILQNGKAYRYAFQGQEKDDETQKEAFQLRLWDGRIGRWLTTDPYDEFYSPYLGMGNNPLLYADTDGGKIVPAPGINMIKYKKYITQLQNNFPEVYNYLENHPTIITVHLDIKRTSDPLMKGKLGYSSVPIIMTQSYGKMKRSLTARNFLSQLDGEVRDVLNFNYYDEASKDINTVFNKTTKILSPLEAERFFYAPAKDGGFGATTQTGSIHVASDAKFSTVMHELGHVQKALQNLFSDFKWGLIEAGRYKKNGSGHYGKNPGGILANELSEKTKAECGCNN
jgi:RHS repeat-associated protein